MRFLTLDKLINSINDWVGKLISIAVFFMIGALLWEVVMRYVFDRPTIWAHEFSAMLYAVFFLLGGAYALRWNAHINVDILYARLSTRQKAVMDLISWLFFYIFCGAMLWEGTKFAWISVKRMELASTVWEPPIWPVKICIPLAAALILLQGFLKTYKDISTAVTGREFSSEDKEAAS